MIHRTTSCRGLKTEVPKGVAQQYVAQHPPVMSDLEHSARASCSVTALIGQLDLPGFAPPAAIAAARDAGVLLRAPGHHLGGELFDVMAGAQLGDRRVERALALATSSASSLW